MYLFVHTDNKYIHIASYFQYVFIPNDIATFEDSMHKYNLFLIFKCNALNATSLYAQI